MHNYNMDIAVADNFQHAVGAGVDLVWGHTTATQLDSMEWRERNMEREEQRKRRRRVLGRRREMKHPLNINYASEH